MNALMTIEQMTKPALPAATGLDLCETYVDMARFRRRCLSAPGPVCGVYFLLCESAGLVKVGCSRNVVDRAAEIQCMSPAPLTLLGSVSGGLAEEARYHSLFGALRAHGEWFLFTQRVRGVVAEDLGVGMAMTVDVLSRRRRRPTTGGDGL